MDYGNRCENQQIYVVRLLGNAGARYLFALSFFLSVSKVRFARGYRAAGRARRGSPSAANADDGARLPDLISKHNTGSGVWADTAYRSKKNEASLAAGLFKSHIHQRRKPRRALPERIAKANTRRSKIRARVEHVFTGQKHRMGLVVRTIGIARASIKIGRANLVYNLQRLVWLEGRAAPA